MQIKFVFEMGKEMLSCLWRDRAGVRKREEHNAPKEMTL